MKYHVGDSVQCFSCKDDIRTVVGVDVKNETFVLEDSDGDTNFFWYKTDQFKLVKQAQRVNPCHQYFLLQFNLSKKLL